MSKAFHVGDKVVYAKQKISTSPGKRAEEISPTPKGDTYTYVVDKYWVVAEVLADGALKLRTRRGKEHTIHNDDPLLRRPSWWEKLLYAKRFTLQTTADPSSSSQPAARSPSTEDAVEKS